MELLIISWPTLILLGLGLRMALRLAYGARGPDASDLLHGFLTITSWVMITIGMVPIILGGFYSIVGAVIVLLAVATLIEIVTQRRDTQRRSLSTLLALLVERRQQIDASTLLASHTLRGRVGRAARRLFAALDGGTPLVRAVRENPGALPREAIAYLAAGRTMGAEAAALRELSQTDHSELATIWRVCVDRISYLACVLTFMLLILTFVMIRIVPSFVDIFTEFEMQLPAMTTLAVRISNIFVKYLAWPVAVLLLLVFLGSAVVGICYLCDVPVLRPVTDRLFRSRRMADILRILAVATESRQPLADVLSRLALVYPSGTIRRQLDSAARALESGADWHEALRQARIVSAAEHGLLKTAEAAGNLPWAFRQIARRREKTSVYRLAGALQVVYPILIVLLGSLVGFFVISLFVPLVQLIQGLTN